MGMILQYGHTPERSAGNHRGVKSEKRGLCMDVKINHPYVMKTIELEKGLSGKKMY